MRNLCNFETATIFGNWTHVRYLPLAASLLLVSSTSQAEPTAQVQSVMVNFFHHSLARSDLAGDDEGKNCLKRIDFPGWEGTELLDCRNHPDSATNPDLRLTGRTLLAVASEAQLADWVANACSDDKGNSDLKCAAATGKQIIKQSGGQFPVAGLVIEKSPVAFEVVGPPFPSTGIRKGPYAPIAGAPETNTKDWTSPPSKEDVGRECENPDTWSYVVSEAATPCKFHQPSGGQTCKVYTRTSLVDYVFSNGVTVFSNDVGPSAKCQLSDSLLANLVANDSASRLTRTYKGSKAGVSESVARVAGTSQAMYVACTGARLDPNDPLAWPKAAGQAYRKALTRGENRNALIDAWVRKGGYTGPNTGWAKCTE